MDLGQKPCLERFAPGWRRSHDPRHSWEFPGNLPKKRCFRKFNSIFLASPHTDVAAIIMAGEAIVRLEGFLLAMTLAKERQHRNVEAAAHY